MRSITYLKRQAKILHKIYPDKTLMQCQHEIAKQLGFVSWSDMLSNVFVDK